MLHKDQLVHGIWRTRDRLLELGATAVEPFFRTMELWLELGVSFVAEQTFYRGVSEPDVARRLAPHGVIVNVHCTSSHALERFVRRMCQDPLCGEERLRTLLPLAERLQAELREPLAFGCPRIVVHTDDGYEPAVGVVIDRIDEMYSPHPPCTIWTGPHLTAESWRDTWGGAGGSAGGS